MKLGIINGWDEGHFKTVSEKGLTAVEFCINYKYDSAEVLARAEEIKGYMVGEDSMKEFTVKLGELTNEERQIILDGCLINYNRVK